MGISSASYRLGFCFFVFSLLTAFIASPARGAAIKGLEEGTQIAFCKQVDYVGNALELTASGLNCTLTSTAGVSGVADVDWQDSGAAIVTSGTLNVLNNLTMTNSGGIATLDIADAYLVNDANDTMAGTLTADGLTLGANENITLGAQTLDHDGTDFVFNDSIEIGASAMAAGSYDASDGNINNVGIISLDSITGDANAIVIGDNGDTVQINSSDWDISTTGVQTGMGNITSNGTITTTGTLTALGVEVTGTLIIPNSNTPPTCFTGEIFTGNNATSGQRLFVCESGTFVVQGDGGGVFDSTTVDDTTWSDNANATNTWTFDVSGTDHTAIFGSAITTWSGGITTTLDLIVNGLDLTLGATGVKMTSDNDGAITFLSISAGNQEDLTLNLDDTANTIVFTSSTGVDNLDIGTMEIIDDASNVADNVIDSAHYAAASVDLEHMSSASVDSDNIVNDTIVDADNANDALDADKIVDDTTDDNDLDVAAGGTGVSTLTDGGILLGSGAGDITALGVATNGQIPIGDGATDPVLAAPTGGNGITVTLGAGTIDHVVEIKDNSENGVGSTDSISGLEFESGELTLLQGCSDNQILKWDETADDWSCEADGGGGGGGGFVILDPQTVKISGTFILDGTMQIDAGEGSWRLLADDSAHEYAMWQFHVPSTYSSDPIFDVTTTALATSGSFDIEMDVMCVSTGESTVSTSFDTINEVTGGTVPDATSGDTTAISIALTNNDSMAAEDLCFFRVGRDFNDTDDVMVGDLEILGGLIRWTE